MAYLFVHFTVEDIGGEQVYFSVSRDGLHWKDLGHDQPVLRWDAGDGGVRDPFIVRHPVTGRFHLMATDLCVKGRRNDWRGAVYEGSRDLVFWESEDLVNWSEPYAVTMAPEGAGCAWAPEAVWDEEKQDFLIFYACQTYEGGADKHRIYAAHTSDFRSFSPVFKYIEREKSIIDTTIIRDGGYYHRFSKDESTSEIRLDRSPALEGEYESVPCPVLDGASGLEGPECFRLPDGRWCLICDQFRAHKGYLPILIDDLMQGEMHVLSEAEYDFAARLKRHGGVMEITDEEYDRLVSRWG